jgi:hypothetical protein
MGDVFEGVMFTLGGTMIFTSELVKANDLLSASGLTCLTGSSLCLLYALLKNRNNTLLLHTDKSFRYGTIMHVLGTSLYCFSILSKIDIVANLPVVVGSTFIIGGCLHTMYNYSVE